MKVYEVDKKEFFKGYTLKYLLFFRKQLDLIVNELNAGNLEQALILTMDRPYIDYPEFNFYRINILIRLGQLDLALSIAEEKKFENFEPIQKQKMGLLEAIKIINEQEEKKKLENQVKIGQDDSVSQESQKLKKMLITRLYVGVLTLEEIDNADLSNFDKILLKICYYDKYNHANGLRYIKSIKSSITDDKMRKTINNFRTRLESKRNYFFDIDIYKKYISGIDFNYAQNLQREIQEKTQLELERKRILEEKNSERTTRSDSPVTVTKKENIQSEKVLVSNTREVEKVKEAEEEKEIPTPPIINTKQSNEEKVSKVKKKKKDIEESMVIKIKDAFANEVEIMAKYLYVEVNNLGTPAAMKAFDIFDSIINQDVNNISALEKFERLVLKFSQDKTIGLSYNAERFNRYLKKEQK
ncbi:MAG: hypothetical protein J5982_01220 [Bacilli bacterium]|nr:hypothetical protein [Bacilli bacterium]